MRAIFYDTETTGVRPEKDRIIEIAAYDPIKNRTFEKLIKPDIPIPKEATAIHNITEEMVASAPNFSEIYNEFLEFCEGEVVLIAHNNDSFDKLFLEYECKRNQLTVPNWKYLDSLKWARRYRPDLPRHTLQSLREVYDFPKNNAHRALDDVIVLHQVFQAMTDDLPITDVYSLLNRHRSLQHMPFGKHQGQPLNSLPKNYVLWLANSGALDKSENQELKSRFLELGLLRGNG